MEPRVPPATTMLGALYRYLREADPRYFQPMNANFGLVDELPHPPRDKREKRAQLAARALADLRGWIAAATEPATPPFAASTAAR
jgi:methylenetetrahydrofolate--tRNA-(uracil-5-)-methyltransferase